MFLQEKIDFTAFFGAHSGGFFPSFITLCPLKLVFQKSNGPAQNIHLGVQTKTFFQRFETIVVIGLYGHGDGHILMSILQNILTNKEKFHPA